jgi:hypothetical protein
MNESCPQNREHNSPHCSVCWKWLFKLFSDGSYLRGSQILQRNDVGPSCTTTPSAEWVYIIFYNFYSKTVFLHLSWYELLSPLVAFYVLWIHFLAKSNAPWLWYFFLRLCQNLEMKGALNVVVLPTWCVYWERKKLWKLWRQWKDGGKI